MENFYKHSRKCNLKCEHCGVGGDCKGEQKFQDRELSLEEYKRIIDEAKAMGCVQIILAGGEPFASKDFLNICDYLNEKQIYFGILTNGVLINEENCIRLSKYKYLCTCALFFEFYIDAHLHDLI